MSDHGDHHRCGLSGFSEAGGWSGTEIIAWALVAAAVVAGVVAVVL